MSDQKRLAEIRENNSTLAIRHWSNEEMDFVLSSLEQAEARVLRLEAALRSIIKLREDRVTEVKPAQWRYQLIDITLIAREALAPEPKPEEAAR